MNKNMMLIMGCMFAMGKIDFDSPATVAWLRVGFLASILYCTGAFYWIFMEIERKKDQTLFVLRPSTEEGKPDVTVKKCSYDFTRLTEGVKNYFTWIVMVGLMNCWSNMQRPLFMTIMLNPSVVADSPLFKIHLLGFPDDGREEELERPWAQESMLAIFGFGSVKAMHKAAKQSTAKALGGGKGMPADGAFTKKAKQKKAAAAVISTGGAEDDKDTGEKGSAAQGGDGVDASCAAAAATPRGTDSTEGEDAEPR